MSPVIGEREHCRLGAFEVAGVVLFAAGLIFRWWAVVTLGRFFTVDVTIEKDHELVERGPFRVVRHPVVYRRNGGVRRLGDRPSGIGRG